MLAMGATGEAMTIRSTFSTNNSSNGRGVIVHSLVGPGRRVEGRKRAEELDHGRRLHFQSTLTLALALALAPALAMPQSQSKPTLTYSRRIVAVPISTQPLPLIIF